MKIPVTILAVAVLAAAAFSTTASARQESTWYWTPGACKSVLVNHGVAINDGRTFNVAKAYCIGLHNHCWLSAGQRRYKVFWAVMRSYDGVVRLMQLTVTGHGSWSGSHMRIMDENMSLSRFIDTYGPTAWNVASVENQGGCFDVHP